MHIHPHWFLNLTEKNVNCRFVQSIEAKHERRKSTKSPSPAPRRRSSRKKKEKLTPKSKSTDDNDVLSSQIPQQNHNDFGGPLGALCVTVVLPLVALFLLTVCNTTNVNVNVCTFSNF